MTASYVGRGVDRADARLKVTGEATYANEVPVANVAYAALVSSTIAKGTITSIDSRPADQSEGVLAVLTPSNAPRLPGATKKAGPTDRVLQLLQDSRVLYSGQPVAVVVADSLERAHYAASQVRVAYDTSAPTAEMAGQLAHAYEPVAVGAVGQPDTKRGDVKKALSSAHTLVDETYSTPIQNHNPMEPHATTAVWHGENRLTVYDATQGIFGVRRKVALVFGLDPENVRVISHYVGGGFGCKGSPWSHVVLAAMAARAVGRPVKLALTRHEMFSVVGHRPETLQRVTLGADADGTLVAIKHEVTNETSSFDEFVEPSAVQTRMLYACANVETSHRLVRLDVGTPTFQRAPGESTGTFALESAMDELAYALKKDPIQLRLQNYAETDPEDDRPWSSKSLKECYRRGAETFGWSKRDPRIGAMRDGRRRVGWGMATATYPARQSPSSAVARARPDGTLLVQAGSQDIGTGTYTIMAQIAADASGVAYERVRFELGDTTFPETPGSGGSQTASSTGSAVKMACLLLRGKLINLAVRDPRSPLHGLKASDVTTRDGALVATRDSAKRDPYEAVVRRTGEAEILAESHTQPKEDRKTFSSHSFGAHFVEVRVDVDLGEVRVSRVVAAFATGKILNAKTARSQFIGGIVWGLGLALLEHTVRDRRTARVVTRDLADYRVPVNADVQAIDVIMIPEDDPHVNEIGAKGIGEIGITGIGAAVANAVYHATGRRVRTLPITLDKLL